MVDWHDQAVQQRCARAATFVANIAAGCYIWEFLVSFGFDWDHLARRRPLRWPIIAYLGARYTCLLAVVASFRVSNVFQAINGCTAWWKFIYICSCTAVAFASLLLVVRVIALYQHSKTVSISLGVLWVGQVVALLYGAVLTRGTYYHESFTCGAVLSAEDRYNTLAPLALDTCCLALAAFYLWQNRGAGLWLLLVQQGFVYLLVIVVAYVPLAVLQALNLNDGMNVILHTPALICLVISSTRMHRGLVEYDRERADDLSPYGPTSPSVAFLAPAFPHTSWRAPPRRAWWSRAPAPERGIVVPPSFAGASVDYHERESVPTAVSPNSSRGKITMFKDSTEVEEEEEA